MKRPRSCAEGFTDLVQEPLPENYTQFLDATGLQGVRIGVLRQLSDVPTSDSQVLALFNAALHDMALQGESFPLRRAQSPFAIL